jgi:hypothetical protein
MVARPRNPSQHDLVLGEHSYSGGTLRSLIGGTEATFHEAEAQFQKKTQ